MNTGNQIRISTCTDNEN